MRNVSAKGKEPVRFLLEVGLTSTNIQLRSYLSLMKAIKMQSDY